MSTPQYYDSGSFNVICDVCGRQFRAFQLNKRWDGLMVCAGDWEPRQPQDFVRGVADIQAPPYSRPEQEDIFIPVCTPITTQGIADYGTADCARADIDNGNRPVCTLEGNSCISGLAVSGCAVTGRPYPGMLVTIYPDS